MPGILRLLLQVIGMITAKDLNELISLKKSDREKFLKLIEEMASLDILLSYKKFKEYPANI
ncbi:hypothetical protein Mtc_0529 [Methanocella conradii HZ254]|uniref:Uncharacterized protein n=1 Tax=Methanocella conradii (strain DSM 24694 / JCM 17849 / CGMCC 1.5162 / HZ254) TaxID=1041930 RepID=H8I598_METCZ|nr:hypothetical protein [Methanocella conradii]AFC99295.1 hypothetical protein Mtc_0529 [Methanocella conradii HZ254]